MGDSAPGATARFPTPATALAAAERLVSGPRCPEGSELARAAGRRLLALTERLGLGERHQQVILDATGVVRAAALAIPGPGRTAQVLASRPRDEAERGLTSAAIAAVADGLHPGEAHVAQALIDEEDSGHGDGARLLEAYLGAGFTPLAVLDSMARARPRRGAAPPAALPGGVTIEPWRRGDRVLLAILDASYERTLDCPGLCGLRRTEDILDGHLAGGRYEAGLWTILRLEGAPMGALLLSASHAGEDLDLVYLGLAVPARGRGLGRALVSHALHQASQRRERRVVLAVDRRNEPAARLYSSAGFARITSRVAVVCPLRRDGAGSGRGAEPSVEACPLAGVESTPAP